MRTLAPDREEILVYENLHNWESLSFEELDRLIQRLKSPRLIAIAEWLKDIKSHMEVI